jgi:chorismate synthase
MFNCLVFANNRHLAALRQCVVTGESRCPLTGMIATGIPPHLAITKSMKELTARLETLETGIRETHEDMKSNLPDSIAAKVS